MSLSPDQRLTDLFVRYLDNALTPAEQDDLAVRLAADPVAREDIRFLSLQAVAAAETGPSSAAPAGPRSRLSRRRALAYIGSGVAASVAGFAGYRYWLGTQSDPVRLTAAVGEVTLKTPAGERAAATGFVPPEAIVSTVGSSSSAVLRFVDGSEVSLAGDTAVTIAGQGRRLQLLRGTATATVLTSPAGEEPVTLGTTEASCSRLGGAVLTLSRILQTTEVGVLSGRANVADAAGDPLEVVHPGEYVTVQSDGRHRKQPVEPTREEFAWDLTRPLPEGWAVGVREAPLVGPPVVRPVLWFDPYHKAEMYQIRSNHQWYKAFAKLQPDSTFRVRYWVERPGPSQLVACVRKDDLGQSDTGVIECNGAFARARPREWQWLEVKAGAMLDNKHTPKFGAAWVAFLIIFNTYQEDLGLRISAFQVIPPGPAAG